MNRGTKLILERAGDESIYRLIETDLDDVEHERSIVCTTGTHKQLRLEDIGTVIDIPPVKLVRR